MLTCQSVSKSFTSTPLFAQLNLSIEASDRLGIVGANGSGKSTLLKVMAGLESADEGSVVMRKNLNLAYVPQVDSFLPSDSARTCLNKAIAATGIDEQAVTSKVREALSRIDLTDADKSVDKLSGGWRKRLALIAALVLDIDLLLLDEPTNHLDIQGINWLEKELGRARFAWAAISHDRQFLENTVNRVVEIGRLYENNIFSSKGRYSDFLERRDEYRSQQASYAQSLANKVRREVEWLKRGPKARGTKSQARIDQAQALQEELHDVKSRTSQRSVDLDFSASGRKTKRLIATKGVRYAVDGQDLINNLDIVLRPRSRLGILGHNGAGKSTLIDLLTKTRQATYGEVFHADDLRWTYFKQGRGLPDPQLTLKQALSPAGDAVTYQGRSLHVVSWAKKFLFRPEQLDIAIERLSGGERARLLIANFMRQETDVMFLDEPTNDLDIPTLEVLEESLQEFQGALVLVSHDRYFLERVCEQYVGLDGRGHHAAFASLEQWLTWLKEQTASRTARKEASSKTSGRTSKPKKLGYLAQRELDGMEEAILAAEKAEQHAQAALEDPGIATNPDKLIEATKKWETSQAEVARLYARWEELEALKTNSEP